MDTIMTLSDSEVVRYLGGLGQEIGELPALVANWQNLDSDEQADVEAEWWVNIRNTWASLTRTYDRGVMSPKSTRMYETTQSALIASLPLFEQLGWSDLRTGILPEAKPVHA